MQSLLNNFNYLTIPLFIKYDVPVTNKYKLFFNILNTITYYKVYTEL